jgi:hypothetical protein
MFNVLVLWKGMTVELFMPLGMMLIFAMIRTVRRLAGTRNGTRQIVRC